MPIKHCAENNRTDHKITTYIFQLLNLKEVFYKGTSGLFLHTRFQCLNDTFKLSKTSVLDPAGDPL